MYKKTIDAVYRFYQFTNHTIETLSLSEKRYYSYLMPAVTGILLYIFFTLTDFYLPLPKQYILGWGLVFLLIVFNKIENFRKPPLRILFVLISVFINIRYLYWRTTETLVFEGPMDTIGTMLLYGAEIYALALHFLGIFANIWPHETKIMPLPEDTSLYPSVDILVPTYNESIDIVKITVIAASNIDYPPEKLHIHILDDGATITKRNNPASSAAAWKRHYDLRRLAGALGVNYITREKNSAAKAGNLNHGLNHTDSDLVLVLDCDHVPARDILKNTVGWFLKDEKLAFVQTPHFFINPNPIEKNIDILRDAPSEHEMFYRANHPGMDFWNASFFCGSAAILRRSYLEEVGGVSGETITEDCETAFSLHKKGYNSVYISRPMICGLSPETFDDFILQRSRWAQGMTQLMVLNNPLFARGLTPSQRLCYFNNAFFWLFGVSRFIFFIAPAAFLILGLHVYFASVKQVFAYAMPHIASSIILANFFYGKYRWPFLSELFESIQSLFLMPVVLSVVLNPRKPSFKVTPKGKNLENEFLSGLTLPFYIMCLLLFAAIPAAVVKWYKFPLYRDVILVTILWTLYNLSLAMAAFGAFFERRQIRRHHRMWAKGRLLIYFPRLKQTVEGKIHDISLSGIGISFSVPFPLKPREHVQLEARDSNGEKYSIEARIQRFVQKGDEYICGTEYVIGNEAQYAASVRFVYSDSQRWVDYWSRHTVKANPFKVLVFIIRMALKGFRISLHASFIFFIAPILNMPKLIAARFFPVPAAVAEEET